MAEAIEEKAEVEAVVWTECGEREMATEWVGAWMVGRAKVAQRSELARELPLRVAPVGIISAGTVGSLMFDKNTPYPIRSSVHRLRGIRRAFTDLPALAIKDKLDGSPRDSAAAFSLSPALDVRRMLNAALDVE